MNKILIGLAVVAAAGITLREFIADASTAAPETHAVAATYNSASAGGLPIAAFAVPVSAGTHSPTLAQKPISISSAPRAATAEAKSSTSPAAASQISWTTVRHDWIYADAPRRVELIDAVVAETDRLTTDDEPSAEAQREITNQFLLANARTERDPAVLLKLLPVLAAQERHNSEPVLVEYLANRSFTAEVRATAAEILVDSGWWTPQQLKLWLNDAAHSVEEREAILQELADAGFR